MTDICRCDPDCTVEYGTCHCECGSLTRIAPQNSVERGWVRGEPIKFIRGHATRHQKVHSLSGLDWQNREADCSNCGRVTFKKNGAGVKCCRRLISEHRLSEIDQASMTAYCRRCRSRVSIIETLASDRSRLVCEPNKRSVDKTYRESVPIEVRRENHRAWRDANREHVRSYGRQRNYGLSEGDVEALRLYQGDRCAICWQPANGTRSNAVLHADHDHVSLANRGMLCGDCNRALGLLRDDPLRMFNAIEYLLHGDHLLVSSPARLSFTAS